MRKIDKNFDTNTNLPEDMEVYNIKENDFALYGLMFDGKYIKNLDINEFKSLKNIKMVTLAPELPDSMDFIKTALRLYL